LASFDPQAFLGRLEDRLAIGWSAGRSSLFTPAVRRRAVIPAWIAGAMAAGIVMLMATGGARGANADREVRLGPQDTGTFRTARGERLHLRLAEGTQVAIAPGSAVRVGAPTDRYGRDVYVTGEAYFDVANDPVRVLTVHAANAVMRDAGARFAVHTDTGAGEVRVVVASGVLMLGDSGRSWRTAHILTRGALGVVSSSGGTRARRARSANDAMVWEAGAARFDPDRLRDALPGRPA
jgi:ferric-dicitrate binding protein FerR (iron transport regulator)